MTATSTASTASPSPKRACSVGRNTGSTFENASFVECENASSNESWMPVRVARRPEDLLSWLTVDVPTSRRYLTHVQRGGQAASVRGLECTAQTLRRWRTTLAHPRAW